MRDCAQPPQNKKYKMSSKCVVVVLLIIFFLENRTKKSVDTIGKELIKTKANYQFGKVKLLFCKL